MDRLKSKMNLKSDRLPKLTSIKNYLTQRTNLNVPATAQDSTTVFLFASSPNGTQDNMVPFPDIDPILPQYQPFPGDSRQSSEGQTTYNLMNDCRIRRGLYTMNKSLLKNVKGEPTGWKRIFPRNMTMPQISPRYPNVSPVAVANEYSCDIMLRGSRHDVFASPSSDYATPLTMKAPRRDSYSTLQEPVGRDGIGPPAPLQTARQIRRSYTLRHGVNGGEKCSRWTKKKANVLPLKQRRLLLQSSKTEERATDCLYKRSPAALIPTWKTELAAAYGWANVGVQAKPQKIARPKSYTVFSQTDPDISKITGVGSTDNFTEPKPSYYNPALLNYYRMLTMNYNVEQGVQVIPYEVFDFNLASRPIVKRLTKAVLEQATFEFVEEQELELLLNMQRQYEIELFRQQDRFERLKRREQKISQERVQYITQGAENQKKDKETEERISIMTFVQSHLQTLSFKGMDSLRDDGFLEDGIVNLVVENKFVPWMQSEVCQTMNSEVLATTLLDDLIQCTVNDRENREAVRLFGLVQKEKIGYSNTAELEDFDDYNDEDENDDDDEDELDEQIDEDELDEQIDEKEEVEGNQKVDEDGIQVNKSEDSESAAPSADEDTSFLHAPISLVSVPSSGFDYSGSSDEEWDLDTKLHK